MAEKSGGQGFIFGYYLGTIWVPKTEKAIKSYKKTESKNTQKTA